MTAQPTPSNSQDWEQVTVPREVFDRLVQVAEYVSMGRSYLLDHPPYPDATARFALGALSEEGLLTPHVEEAGDA
jgi:hypothetical protein